MIDSRRAGMMVVVGNEDADESSEILYGMCQNAVTCISRALI